MPGFIQSYNYKSCLWSFSFTICVAFSKTVPDSLAQLSMQNLVACLSSTVPGINFNFAM